MFATVYNCIALTSAALLLAFIVTWLVLCRMGWVNFPAFMVRGYNIHRARRQAERKLRWAEKRRRYWEVQHSIIGLWGAQFLEQLYKSQPEYAKHLEFGVPPRSTGQLFPSWKPLTPSHGKRAKHNAPNL